MKRLFILFLLTSLIFGCKDQTGRKQINGKNTSSISLIKYAKGIDILKYKDFTKLIVKEPFPGSDHALVYYLIPKDKTIPDSLKGRKIIRTPVNKLVATSTTHIPMIEIFGKEHTLTGFPQTQYISSRKTVKRVQEGKVKELGNTEDINTEMLLELEPEIVIGFSLGSNNKMYRNIEASGIPVIFDAEWLEETPLGRAEWLKLFGALYNMDDKAKNLFMQIDTAYKHAKELAQKAERTPTVLTGSLYKDKWNLPAGGSFMATLLHDANTDYFWSYTKGKGSLVLSLESVLAKAANADLWIAAGRFTSFQDMENANIHYKRFKAFKNREVYTFSKVKGPNGGIEYFEMAPIVPHIVLYDIIKVAHPGLLPDYKTRFLKKLD